MTTKPNVLNIDYTAILNAATLRTQNLQALGELIGNNISQIVEKAHDVRTFLEMASSRWGEIDPEGRGLAPKEVQRVMSYVRTQLSNMDMLISNHDVGLSHLEKFGKPEFNVSGTSYTIKAALSSPWTTKDLVDSIQCFYDEGNIAGSFQVESGANDWHWITFTRDLGGDSEYISDRIAKSNFNIGGETAACNQLIAEFTEGNGDDEFVAMLCKAISMAEVRFPQPAPGPGPGV